MFFNVMSVEPCTWVALSLISEDMVVNLSFLELLIAFHVSVFLSLMDIIVIVVFIASYKWALISVIL